MEKSKLLSGNEKKKQWLNKLRAGTVTIDQVRDAFTKDDSIRWIEAELVRASRGMRARRK